MGDELVAGLGAGRLFCGRAPGQEPRSEPQGVERQESGNRGNRTWTASRPGPAHILKCRSRSPQGPWWAPEYPATRTAPQDGADVVVAFPDFPDSERLEALRAGCGARSSLPSGF
jgi:hypothetical protein